jgi:hypothetical protein
VKKILKIARNILCRGAPYVHFRVVDEPIISRFTTRMVFGEVTEISPTPDQEKRAL